MSLRKIGFATIIVILVSLAFTSCDSDRYSWYEGQVNSNYNPRSDGGGIFAGVYDIDINADVYDIRGRSFGYVSDLDFQTGHIAILADKDMYGPLRLVAFSEGRQIATIDLSGIVEGSNIFSDRGVYNFLYDVSEGLRRYGYVDVEYSGESRYRGRSYININIAMDVDAYVRD